jgi:hypothetical protein
MYFKRNCFCMSVQCKPHKSLLHLKNRLFYLINNNYFSYFRIQNMWYLAIDAVRKLWLHLKKAVYQVSNIHFIFQKNINTWVSIKLNNAPIPDNVKSVEADIKKTYLSKHNYLDTYITLNKSYFKNETKRIWQYAILFLYYNIDWATKLVSSNYGSQNSGMNFNVYNNSAGSVTSFLISTQDCFPILDVSAIPHGGEWILV